MPLKNWNRSFKLYSCLRATAESGFSINQEVIIENLTEQSLVNLRLVYDSSKPRGGAGKVEVDKAMLAEARKASNRYKTALAEKKKREEEEESNSSTKRKLEAELRDVATKRRPIRNVAAEKILSLEKKELKLKEAITRLY